MKTKATRVIFELNLSHIFPFTAALLLSMVLGCKTNADCREPTCAGQSEPKSLISKLENGTQKERETALCKIRELKLRSAIPSIVCQIGSERKDLLRPALIKALVDLSGGMENGRLSDAGEALVKRTIPPKELNDVTLRDAINTLTIDADMNVQIAWEGLDPDMRVSVRLVRETTFIEALCRVLCHSPAHISLKLGEHYLHIAAEGNLPH